MDNDEDIFRCKDCGCDVFNLVRRGPHLRGYCASCGKQASDHNNCWLEQKEERPTNYERATEAQIKYLENLIANNGEKLSKGEAGNLIQILKTKEE